MKGSFTGAYRDKPGKLETAHMGTIFLDEVGEMTLRMQGLLLRFLETGELQKVGADGSGRIVNVRVIAATNRDLRDMIKQGTFREDLFYRLNVIHIVVPPLRDRREDIPVLANQFLDAVHRGEPLVDHWRIARGDEGADRVLVAWQRSRARERDRAPGRDRERSDDRASSTCRPRFARTTPSLLRPKRERRRTVADDLYKRMIEQHESFWTAVYPLFMDREITRANVREVVRRGLEEARGNYKIVARLFNMEARDYKRFLNFLRKHDCQIPFKEYR